MKKRTIVFIRAVPIFFQALLIRILPAIIHVNTVNKNDLQNTHTQHHTLEAQKIKNKKKHNNPTHKQKKKKKKKTNQKKLFSFPRLTCYSSYNSPPPHPE